MREIPMRYIKANQSGIVLFAVIFLITGQLWLLAALWIIEVVSLLTKGKLNLFIRLAKPFLSPGKETQAEELARFNNSLAVTFISLALITAQLGWVWGGYVFTAMLLGAAGAALLGYCIGCTIYYQYKQFRIRQERSRG